MVVNFVFEDCPDSFEQGHWNRMEKSKRDMNGLKGMDTINYEPIVF